MRTIYITIALFAILLLFFLIVYSVNIPAPSKTIVEKYSLEVK